MIFSNTLRSAMGTFALTALAIAAMPADTYALCAAMDMGGAWRSPIQATTTGIVYLEITFPCNYPGSAPEPATIRVLSRPIKCGLSGGGLCDWGEQAIGYKFWSETATQYTFANAVYDFGWDKKTLKIFLLEDGRLWVFTETKFTDPARRNYSTGEYFVNY